MVSQYLETNQMASVIAQPQTQIDIFTDSSFTSCTEEDQSSVDLGSNDSAPLRSISVSKAQNRQSKPSPVESLSVELKKFHIGEPHEISRVDKRKPDCNFKSRAQSGSRLTRPQLATNTFEELETVFEDDCRDPSTPAAIGVSDDSQRYIELRADQYSNHPLATAARNLPSVQEQLAKHRDGDFEWVLTVKLPTRPSNNKASATSDITKSSAVEKVLFGCNLFSSKAKSESEDKNPEHSSLEPYTLLVTPLEWNAELETAAESADDTDMAVAGMTSDYATPTKALESLAEVSVMEVTPSSRTPSSRTPPKYVARIDDPFEALDKLEEQMEAFNVAAHMEGPISPDMQKPATRSPQQPFPAKFYENTRVTPQPKRPSTRTGTSTLRVNSQGPTRSPSVRKSTSMIFLDSPKMKEEDKVLVQAPPKKTASKGLASLLPPKQLAKSSKPRTMPTFELPGEAVARRLKEQREARLSMAAASPAAAPAAVSGIRRTLSTKPPTYSNYELPGEAISRRKREEHIAKYKAQDEAERKRREFRAKPIRSGAAPSSVPRDTITSRARQSKPNLENSAYQTSSTPSKRSSSVFSRDPLSSTNNQPLARGRHLTMESSVTSEMSRATSSSTGSMSGKRSSVSLEDIQQQRLRGREVLHRDSFYGQDREREKRDREALARLAREQAAERSRLLSREWAEKQKQKQKRMTVGSLRDVIASS